MMLRSGKRKCIKRRMEINIDDNNNNNNVDDNDSIHSDQGVWEDDTEQVPWFGCVCGIVHPRPIQVFWVQCDEIHCRSWYNVAEKCVGMTSTQASSSDLKWLCPDCSRGRPPFLDLPEDILYYLFTFIQSRPIDRHLILYHQIGTLCKSAYRAIKTPSWDGLFSRILRDCRHDNIAPNHNQNRTTQQLKLKLKQHPSPSIPSIPSSPSRRQSKRRHQKFRRYAPLHNLSPRDELRDLFLHSCARTDDAHMALQAMGESQNQPLSLPRLRNLFRLHSPIRINRRSPGVGRTFLIECCAADYVNETVVLRCVTELIRHYQADPNVFTTDEHPWADRPALYFAIARVMPAVVRVLLQDAGASLTVEVEGKFRLVSDPNKFINGRFTPLGFAMALRKTESEHDKLPPYYISKLGRCIRVLSETVSK